MSNANLRGVPASMLRIDTSRASEYLYADKPKLSFWQKLGRGFGKAFSFLGPIGAAVTAIAVPGAGIPIAAGIYGLSQVSKDLTSNALSKDAATMDEYNDAVAKSEISVPGLFQGLSSEGDVATDFIAPSEFAPAINQTLLQREGMQQENIANF